MRFSKLISLILHPIFMPLLALYLSLTILPELKFTINHNLKLIYFIIIISTIVLPLISILILMKIGRVNSVEMMSHKERVFPLFNTAIWMLFGCFFLQNILLYAPLLMAEFLGAFIIISFASVLSNFWKISLHMLGIGGILGAFIAIQILYKNTTSLILIFVLLSGILAYARLNENAHNKSQVYVGFLVGLLIELIVVINY
ncbi:hypothetical protein OAJ65_00405 [Flavobacteriales bacterium]|nr:hypothetical protein [Flavobacteriales bacterium]